MFKKMLQELKVYHDELIYIGNSARTVDEILTYMKSIGGADSTIGRHIKAFKDGEVSWVMYADERFHIDKDKVKNFMDSLSGSFLGREAICVPCVTSDDINKVRIAKNELTEQIKILEKAVSKRDLEITNYKEEIERLQVLNKELEEKVDKYIKAEKSKEVSMPVLVLDSLKLLPDVPAFEKQFICMGKLDESGKAMDNNEGTVFNEKNYKKSRIQHVFTIGFLKEKIKRLLDKGDKLKFTTDKVYLQGILDNGNYSNQEKLALYAAFSDYRHTDMEKLLNFAGDSNINADLLIRWCESLVDEMDFLQLKNSLRQFAKPSEYQIKYEFAKELLRRDWIIEFKIDDEDTRFMLVSEKDIAKVKEMLNLSNETFTYKLANEAVEYTKIDEKPDFVKSYNIDDGAWGDDF